MTSRLDFVRLLGSAPLTAAVASGSGAPVALPRDFNPDDRLDGALVLSGGGSRGAYEAGVVGALVRAAGITDGQRLPMFSAVLGTSVGSLNAYFVATGQYSRLAQLWHGISGEDIFAPKARFRAATDASSGVLSRVYEALSLERGLVTNVGGVLDRDHFAAFIDRNVDGERRPLVPFIFTATNLSDERAEVFYRGPQPVTPGLAKSGEAAVASVVGNDTRAREIGGKLLSRALLASAAIPVLFDPVELTFDGVTSQFIDGGIADNSPIDIAKVIAKNIYAILVDPQVPPHVMYHSAAEIGFAAFGVAQRRILETALRTASIESEGKAIFSASATVEQRAFLEHIYDTRLFTIRPSDAGDLGFTDFSSQAKIDAEYARGFADGAAGWQAYRRQLPLRA